MPPRPRVLPLALLMATLAAHCRPALDDRLSLVSDARVIAVRAEPAEAAPGESITLHALYADRTGTLREGPLDWAFCTQRKALAELAPVDPRCLAVSAAWLVPIGTGLDAMGALPMNGCALFGPDPPTTTSADGAGRAVDPDPTGGFYQPVRVLESRDGMAQYTVFEARIACGLSGVTQAQSAEFRQRYVRNENPVVAALAWLDGDAVREISAGEIGVSVPAGVSVRLRVQWPESGAGGAETYAYFDRDARAVSTRREAMRVTWFASDGAFANEHTGRTADDPVSQSENGWTAPSRAGDVVLWVVLRDDRGGVAWESYRVNVE